MAAQALVTEYHTIVRAEAIRDNEKWGNSGNPDIGYECVVHGRVLWVSGKEMRDQPGMSAEAGFRRPSGAPGLQNREGLLL